VALNIGGVSDSSHPFFVLPAWLGIPTEGLESFFYTLFQISQLYFVLLFFIGAISANKKIIKYSVYMCLLGILLIGTHIGIVLSLYQDAKRVNKQVILQEQERSIVRLNDLLAFNIYPYRFLKIPRR
jgi:hypothetical protein